MMPFGSAEIDQLTRDIWTNMLAIPIAAEARPKRTISTPVCACVHITGEWEGAVLLKCSIGLAKRAAAAFLAGAEQNVSSEEMKDALGELANMTAGSIKPLLPGPCHISLPTVIDGNDYGLRIPKGCLAAERAFSSGGDMLILSVIRPVASITDGCLDPFSEQISDAR